MDAEKKEVLDAVRAVRKKGRSSRARDWTVYLIVIALVALMGLGWWAAENRYQQERDGRITAQENRNDLEDAFIDLTNEYQDRTGETPDVTIPAQTPSPSSAPTPGTPEDGEDGRDGLDGLDGRGIASALCNADGTWSLLLTDGATLAVSGPCVGQQGPAGESIAGPQGVQGVPGQSIVGSPGQDGQNGRGVSSVSCGSNGSWTVTYTDGTSQSVTGPCVAQAGAPGRDGSNGVGISAITCDSSNNWQFTMTDGSVISVPGPCRADNGNIISFG